MRLMHLPVIVQLRRTLRLVWQSGPGWTVVSVALLVAQAALPLLTLYLIKLVVDAVAAAIPGQGVAFGRVAVLVGLTGAVAVVSAVCRSLARFVSEGQAQAVTDHMLDILHAKAVEVDLEHYENSQYHDTLQRALQEASFRPTHILNGLIQVAQSSIALLVMAGLLFSFHWGVAVILFAAAVPGVILRARYTGQVYRWQRQNTPAERRAWYFHWLLTGIVHAKEVRLFDLGPLFRGRFRDARTRLRRERLGLATRRCAADLAGQSSLILAVFGAYAFIAYRAVQGAITIGDLVMYYQAFQRGQDFLREMLTGLAGLYEDHLFLRSVYEFLDLDRKVLEPPAPKPMPRPLRTGIVFDHVTFHYPTGTREVLQDVSLTIRPGESIALVGENGSGKTTLVKLLCRLYDPTGGAITIDGTGKARFCNGRAATGDRSHLSGLRPVPGDGQGEHLVRQRRGGGRSRSDRRGGAPLGRRRGHQGTEARLRHHAGQVVRPRRRAQHRRMAEGGPGAGVHAQRAERRARRADQCARCEGRIRGVQAVSAARRGPDHHPHQPSTLDGQDGRPDLRARRRANRRERYSRRVGARGGPVWTLVRNPGSTIPLTRWWGSEA